MFGFHSREILQIWVLVREVGGSQLQRQTGDRPNNACIIAPSAENQDNHNLLASSRTRGKFPTLIGVLGCNRKHPGFTIQKRHSTSSYEGRSSVPSGALELGSTSADPPMLRSSLIQSSIRTSCCLIVVVSFFTKMGTDCFLEPSLGTALRTPASLKLFVLLRPEIALARLMEEKATNQESSSTIPVVIPKYLKLVRIKFKDFTHFSKDSNKSYLTEPG